MGWLTDALFGSKDAGWKNADGDPVGSSNDPDVVAPEEPVAAEQPDTAEVQQPQMSQGPKIIPEVMIDRVKAHYGADMHHVEVWLYFRNISQQEVELRTMALLGQHTNLYHTLRPGMGYELKVYTGEMPHTNLSHKAELQYKMTSNGDFFRATYIVRFQLVERPNGQFYVPEQMSLIRPIHDM